MTKCHAPKLKTFLCLLFFKITLKKMNRFQAITHEIATTEPIYFGNLFD